MSFDLYELRHRVLYAKSHGFAVAKTPEYVKLLGGGVPPEGVAVNSYDHLLHLIMVNLQPKPIPIVPKVEEEPVPVQVEEEHINDANPSESITVELPLPELPIELSETPPVVPEPVPALASAPEPASAPVVEKTGRGGRRNWRKGR